MATGQGRVQEGAGAAERDGARDGLTNSEELSSVLYIYMLLTLAMA